MKYNAILKGGNSHIDAASISELKTWLQNISISFQLDESKLPSATKPKAIQFPFGEYKLVISPVVTDQPEDPIEEIKETKAE